MIIKQYNGNWHKKLYLVMHPNLSSLSTKALVNNKVEGKDVTLKEEGPNNDKVNVEDPVDMLKTTSSRPF